MSTEAARLDALRQLDLLDTPPSEAFDRITRMAAQLFRLPIAAVSLTDFDRQWFKSRVGVEHRSIPRERAPCAEVAETTDPLLIPDLLAHPCYQESLLARSGIRFYAGAPLVTRDGYALGAMCVLGTEPREATATEMSMLADLAAMVMSQIELQHAFGRIDPMSSLPNRLQFIEDLEDMARDLTAPERRLAVLVDLAGSEQINQAVRVLGPDFIDEQVRHVARQLRQVVGPQRRAYHVAATQFAFLARSGAEEEAYADRLAETLERLRGGDARFLAGATAGVAPFMLGETEPQDVLRIAYSAAQDARQVERRVGLFSSAQDAAHRRRFTLLDAFAKALERPEQLRLVFQPRVDLASGRCTGAEALLRWRHPTLGDVSPGEFMPLVEQTAMARPATAWVLEQAMTQLAAWRRAGLDLRLSVNISATNLTEPDFAERVREGLARHGLEADWLELELTESAVMADAGQALAVLESLAGMGLRLAIDDFGTGYSSLSYLQRLPVHVVKIDRSFVQGLTEDGRRRSLVSAMIALLQDLGHRVVAEGVETDAVLDLLVGDGCDEAQGYLIGRPMAAKDLDAWLRARQEAVPAL
ncbi:putative bifunctional diguanylate cyclase/phosphodiesterase [Belnapia rosea]|uniref:EAL domain, c-di-GMP-specific phosphodiesterase class I (Or its enzymatically inactive variant) n=1 Tax=Belnapia rosea TaxID=938405 RepID=A0A1G7BIP9_9PROT|nr:GGDEF and EAL domain-containing protein [Belnapia rosea]SDE26853.1 EAL domain, c-di-GMP-specific phosphodiesterase class I (or its enzymatically inactive variant) [Belnapia rosea]